jgi:hypothetical protein
MPNTQMDDYEIFPLGSAPSPWQYAIYPTLTQSPLGKKLADALAVSQRLDEISYG